MGTLFFCSMLQGQTFDLYTPENSVKKNPLVIFVHGGAWVSGDKSQYKDLAPTFTQNKICFVNMNYSLASIKKHPAPINDLNTVLFELKNYKNLKCDIKNIILIGHSAGAHLIAYWATQYKNEAVKLLVGLEGIYDIPQLAKDWPSYVDWFIKAEFGSRNNWSHASPYQLIFKNKTPWLVVHSVKDELVNTKQSTDFAAHLKSQKISVEYLNLLNETHFGVVDLLKTSQSVLSQKLLKIINKN